MTVQATDIALVLSGGSNNLDQSMSLGGGPSSFRVTSGNLNNLYDDVTPDQALDGHTAHRCVYIFNDGDAYVYNIKAWIDSQTAGSPSNISLGLSQHDEVQRLTLSGQPTGGSFQLSYLGHIVTSSYNSNFGAWANSLQTSLQSITDSSGHFLLASVLVTATQTPSSLLFDVVFGGQGGSRNHDLFSVPANNIVPAMGISTGTIQAGSPINTIAPHLDAETTPPGDVAFSSPSSLLPFILPNLGPSDGFPLWVRRKIQPKSKSLASDTFTLGIKMQSVIST